MELPPLAVDLPPEALRVLRGAQELHTPCGPGHVVWHAWGAGEPLVLLHGGSGSWTHWVRNIEALVGTGRRVLAADLPGFGDSAKVPGSHDADALADTMAAGIRAVAGAPCDVVGFSFGGLTAALTEAAHSGTIRRLVLVGAPGFGLATPVLPLRVWRGLPPEQANEAQRHNLRKLMLHAPEAADDFAVALQAANTARDRMLRRRLAMTDILVRTLPALGCTVHGIWGARDALFLDTLDDVRRLLAAAPRFGQMLVVPDAGHWVQFEQPERFHSALASLIA